MTCVSAFDAYCRFGYRIVLWFISSTLNFLLISEYVFNNIHIEFWTWKILSEHFTYRLQASLGSRFCRKSRKLLQHFAVCCLQIWTFLELIRTTNNNQIYIQSYKFLPILIFCTRIVTHSICILEWRYCVWARASASFSSHKPSSSPPRSSTSRSSATLPLLVPANASRRPTVPAPKPLSGRPTLRPPTQLATCTWHSTPLWVQLQPMQKNRTKFPSRAPTINQVICSI